MKLLSFRQEIPLTIQAYRGAHAAVMHRCALVLVLSSALAGCSARASSVGGADGSTDFVAPHAQPTYRGDPACDVPGVPAKNGSCVTVGGAVTCNPVTQEPCAAGQACVPDNHGGTQCRTLFPNETLKVCDLAPGPTGDQGCGAGLMPTRSETTHQDRCALQCCDDSDCGSGQCVRYVHEEAPYENVGECLNPVAPPR